MMHKSGRNDTKNPGASCLPSEDRQERYLRDYIERKKESDSFFDKSSPKKLTFEEWAEDSQIIYRSVETKADLVHYLQLCWKAAQENMPSQAPGTGAPA